MLFQSEYSSAYDDDSIIDLMVIFCFYSFSFKSNIPHFSDKFTSLSLTM